MCCIIIAVVRLRVYNIIREAYLSESEEFVNASVYILLNDATVKNRQSALKALRPLVPLITKNDDLVSLLPKIAKSLIKAAELDTNANG